MTYKDLRIVGNRYDNPEMLERGPEPEKPRDRHTLLPGEFHVRGLYSNGCMCQPDVVYVARWLIRFDGRGKKGQLRIWAFGSWVEDGKRYGSFCDWDKSILVNYEVLPGRMTREAYEKFKRECLGWPKQNKD